MSSSGLPLPYYQDDAVTIYHGDCRELMPSLTANLVLTDAPYNADFNYGEGTDDSRVWVDYGLWLGERVRLMERASTGPVLMFVSVRGALGLTRIHPPHWVGAWTRPTAGNPAGDNRGTLILPTWEPCLFYGDMTAVKCALSDVWRTEKLAERNGHPCPKPVSLIRQILDKIPGETVLDPFMGSGTTLRAAKDGGRKAIGIDIEEKFCEIAALRCAQEVLDLEAA
jgi:site-specific DNA-methyltransferase (adenine-specific)